MSLLDNHVRATTMAASYLALAQDALQKHGLPPSDYMLREDDRLHGGIATTTTTASSTTTATRSSAARLREHDHSLLYDQLRLQ